MPITPKTGALFHADSQLISGLSGHYCAQRADEEHRTEPRFQFANSAADGRRLHSQYSCGSPKTAMIRGCDDVVDVTDFYRHAASSSPIMR